MRTGKETHILSAPEARPAQPPLRRSLRQPRPRSERLSHTRGTRGASPAPGRSEAGLVSKDGRRRTRRTFRLGSKCRSRERGAGHSDTAARCPWALTMSSESRPMEMTVLFTVRRSFSVMVCTCLCVGPCGRTHRVSRHPDSRGRASPGLLLQPSPRKLNQRQPFGDGKWSLSKANAFAKQPPAILFIIAH